MLLAPTLDAIMIVLLPSTILQEGSQVQPAWIVLQAGSTQPLEDQASLPALIAVLGSTSQPQERQVVLLAPIAI